MHVGSFLKPVQHLKTLIDNAVSRSPDDKPAQTGKGTPASAQRESGVMTLDQVKLSVGDSIQLQFQSDIEPSRSFVTLVGYLKGQSVIVTTPIINGTMMLVREGQDFVIRLFSGKSVYAFSSKAIRVTNTPYPHLHLSYPKEVRGQVIRGSPRGRINIICHATVEDGRGYACVARDISIGGALIAVSEKIGDVGAPLTLKFRVKVGDTEHVLSLDCIIRSVNASRPAEDEKPATLHGLSFEALTSQDTLVISTMLYQNMVSAQAADL